MTFAVRNQLINIVSICLVDNQLAAVHHLQQQQQRLQVLGTENQLPMTSEGHALGHAHSSSFHGHSELTANGLVTIQHADHAK